MKYPSDKSRAPFTRSRTLGFTLIELMITIVVLGILAAIAIPIYEHQVQESRRTDGRSAVLELAAREERYYATNNTYTATPSSLGYNATAWPVDVAPNDYYSVSVQMNPAAIPSPSFIVTATAIGAQAADTACATLSVDSTGAQTATGSGANASSTCWAP